MQRDEDEDEGRLTIQKRSNGSEHTMDQRPRQYNGAYNRLLTGVHAVVFPVVPRPGLIRPCLGTAKVKFKSMMAWKVSKYLAHSIYMYLQLVYNYTHLSLPPERPSLYSCLCALKGSWPSADLRWYFSQSFCRPIEAVWALLMHRIGWELKASSGAWGIKEPIEGKQTCSTQCKL